MNEKERRIVSLPPGLWAEVESVAGKRKVSEWITEAIEEKLTPRRERQLKDALDTISTSLDRIAATVRASADDYRRQADALAARVAELEGRNGAE